MFVSRPFGATAMLGTWSKEDGAQVTWNVSTTEQILAIDIAWKCMWFPPQMYCVEPSGTGYGYWGCAAGKAKSAAKVARLYIL